MHQHISEQRLEAFFLSPADAMEEERNAITRHCELCASCAENFHALQTFYTELSAALQQSPTAEDVRCAEDIFSRKVSPHRQLEAPKSALRVFQGYLDIITPQLSLWRKVRQYAKEHPLKSTGATSLAFGIVAALYFVFKPISAKTNLEYARAEKEFLIAYNHDGQELWRKHIGIGYDIETKLYGSQNAYENYLVVLDVDNDGTKEIIANFGPFQSFARRKEIICFNADGSERWSYAMKQEMTFGKEKIFGNYYPSLLVANDFDHNGIGDVVMIANNDTYYPTSIVHLNASDGTILSEYWHCGNICDIKYLDIDHDGIDEILCIGQNNSFNLASFTIFDPRSIVGHSPSDSSRTPVGIPAGTEKYYILFPRSDLQILATAKRNIAESMHISNDSLIRINVGEHIGSDKYYHLYFFDSKFQCFRVDGEDWFITFHRKMEAEKKLTRQLDAHYYEELRTGVQYWNGEKFVNEPTMNKWYLISHQKFQ
jgi:hypothetical protein